MQAIEIYLITSTSVFAETHHDAGIDGTYNKSRQNVAPVMFVVRNSGHGSKNRRRYSYELQCVL